jgi:hypothetical protein
MNLLRSFYGADRLDLDIKIRADRDIGPWSNMDYLAPRAKSLAIKSRHMFSPIRKNSRP